MRLTRGLLEEFVKARNELSTLQQRIDYYANLVTPSTHGVVKGSMNDFPYAECHFVISGSDIKSDVARQEKVKQLVSDLREREKHYEDLCFNVGIAIESIEETEIREIFRKKYVELMSDKEIAVELHLERSAITKKISRYLEKQCACA